MSRKIHIYHSRPSFASRAWCGHEERKEPCDAGMVSAYDPDDVRRATCLVCLDALHEHWTRQAVARLESATAAMERAKGLRLSRARKRNRAKSEVQR